MNTDLAQMVKVHPMVKILNARVNVLLLELAENEDPKRKSLHGLTDKLDKIKGLGSRFAHMESGSFTQQDVCKAQRDLELLSSKKQVMRDIIQLVESLEESLGVLRNNANEEN